MYIWEVKNWPDLTWDRGYLATSLAQASREQGRLLGRMQSLGFDLRREAQLSTLTEDVVRSSEIEGEKLDADQVRSSIARRLGMDIGGLAPVDRYVEGVVEMMLDARVRSGVNCRLRVSSWCFGRRRDLCAAHPARRDP